MGDEKIGTSCVICTLPRSGSWLLAEALNNTGLVGQPEEYFRPDHMHLWRERWKLRPRSSFDRFIQKAIDFSATDNGVFSVKMHWYQFAWFIEQLHALDGPDVDEARLIARWLPDPHYVYLIRHDKARQAISYWRAARSQVWFVAEDGAEGVEGGVDPGMPGYTDRSTDPDEPPDFAQIRGLERLLVQHERRWLDYFDTHHIRPLTVLYEHFVADYERTVTGIVDWLGIERPPDLEIPPPGLRKQADESTEVILEQYLAVRETL